ncbi:MAG: PAS domain S-box protein, partial [Acidobacteria bacterium]
MIESYHILLIEDEPSHAMLVERAFRQESPQDRLTACASLTEAMQHLEQDHFDVVVTDFALPDASGLQLLEEIQRRRLDLPVIVITGFGDETTAVRAMKLGAADYIVKSENYARTLPLVVHKVLDRRRLEHRLAEAEARYRQLYEQAHRFFTLSRDMFGIAGVDGRFRYLNPAWERILGITRDDLLARPMSEFIHPDDRQATMSEIHRLAEGVETVSFENRFLCGDGSYRWLWWHVTGSAEEGLLYCVAHDVTGRKRMEQDLCVQKVYWEHLFEAAPVAIALLDKEDRVLRANNEFLNLFGYTREEVLGQRIADLIVPEEHREEALSLTQHVAGGETI